MIETLQAEGGIKPISDLNWVLSGFYHKPRLDTATVFAHAFLKWVPPPARVLDPTAGPRRMWQLLFNHRLDSSARYDVLFGDIDPQAPDVQVMDACKLPRDFTGLFDAVVEDPPYRRDLAEDKPTVQKYKASRKFDLAGFLIHAIPEAWRVLKPHGFYVLKIGDNHRKTGKDYYGYVLEDWHIFARNICVNTGFTPKDSVGFQPWYKPRWAPKTNHSIQRHSFFLFFEKVS